MTDQIHASPSSAAPDRFADPALDPTGLALGFAAMNETVHDGGDVRGALQRLVDAAVPAHPGARWAGLTTWSSSRGPAALAGTDPLTETVDRAQHTGLSGPALEPAALTVSADLQADERWPSLGDALRRSGSPVRAALVMPVSERPARTVLGVYSDRPGAFDDDTAAAAALFTAHARVLLMHVTASDKAANLNIALGNARQIGAAMGILMFVHKVTNDEAFGLLRMTSQRLHRKLRDIADEVVETGALPAARSGSGAPSVPRERVAAGHS